MRRRLFFISLSAFAVESALAQTRLLDSLTQADARRGVREALSLAAQNAVSNLGAVNGFYGNPAVHIPLPERLARFQSSLSRMGLSKPLDDLELSMNRAAERTMPEAGALFANAVRNMTISDAIEIVRGPQDSATRFLRSHTETRLARTLRPIMTDALTQSGAFGLLRSALSQIGLSSTARQMRGEIIDFSVSKALDGAFFLIAREEAAIRRDPWRRGTDILRRVFGSG